MRIKTVTALAALCFAQGGAAMDFIDVAPVVSVTPLYGPDTDGRECLPDAAGPQPVMAGAPPGAAQAPASAPPQERSVLAPIAGGVAGALLGSQVGQGRGRDAATAVGAVAGTVAADRIANPNAGGSTTGALVGGAAGALLGNQVGSGTGRTAATAAGAIGGAVVGDRVMSSPGAAPVAGAQPPQAQAPRCRTVDGVTREAIKGYSVVYRYSGRDITTTLPFHPGNQIRVAIGALDNANRPAAAPQPPAAGIPGLIQQPGLGVPPGAIAPR